MKKALGAKLLKPLTLLYTAALLITVAALCIGGIVFKYDPMTSPGVRKLEGFTYEIDGGESGEVTLPTSFEPLSPRTKVTLFLTLDVHSHEHLLFQSVYAPLRIYMDDELLFECGQDGTYPSFMLDPPAFTTILPLPQSTASQHQLRFEFLSPTQRDILSIDSMLAGESSDLFVYVQNKYVFLFAFSILLMVFGVVTLFAWTSLFRGIASAEPFLWLGLFVICAGLWGFGECMLTNFVINRPVLLYLMAFGGLFTMTIPFLRFGILALQPRAKLPLQIMLAVNCVCALVAFALQLFGIVALSRSMYVFHVIVPISFVIFALCATWEGVHHKNKLAQRFLFPMVVLALASVMELVNYQVRFTNILTLFFQSGMLIFVLMLGKVGAQHMRDGIANTSKRVQLEAELSTMNRQLVLQQEQYASIAKTSAEVRQARHDLRHHMAVLKGYTACEDLAGLNEYLDKMNVSTPSASERMHCENFAVNAIIYYYLALAEKSGIPTTLDIEIPSDTGVVADKDLCVIIGNLLENALEACNRQTEGERFIIMNSHVQHRILTITVDNSFDGKYERHKGTFYSRKREGKGLGLSSVSAVVKKYGGVAKFNPEDTTFFSSVFVKM